jgi:hypothetical protein
MKALSIFKIFKGQTNISDVKANQGKFRNRKKKFRFAEKMVNRRDMVKGLAILPFVGPALLSKTSQQQWISYEEKNLRERLNNTVRTGSGDTESANRDKILKVPHAKIKNVEISRMILGGNLIGGWAHSRDLVYVSDLVKKYFTDEKVFETFAAAEKFGINAFLTNPILCRVINEYWKQKLGNIKFISDGGFNWTEGIPQSVDNGACACYVHGGVADSLVQNGKVDDIGKALDLIRQYNIPAGIGAHNLATVKACVDKGLVPDFWMKTLHHTNYWSANKENQNDNIWCTDPEETKEFMKNLKQPWIAYKTLAAGAIEPKVGMKYAFENGADFICVGMFDFQIEEDVKTVVEILNADLKRDRPWMS